MPTTSREIPALSVLRATQVELAAQGIDFAKPGYRRGWRLLAKAAVGSGVDARAPEVTHWVMNLGILRALDQLVDEDGEPDIRGAVDEVTSGRVIKGVTPSEASLFKGVFDWYDEGRQQRQSTGLASLATFAQRRRHAASVRDLIGVNLAEAHMFAGLLQLPIEQQHDSRQVTSRQRFNRWTEGFSRVGYLLDSCFDMRKDYQARNVQVAPTLAARLVIARTAIPETLEAARLTPACAVGSILDTAFKANILERAR